MARPAKYARIAITLPETALAAADRLAADQDRSRSWIVAEAVRQYVAQQTSRATTERLGASRSEQLRRDLTQTTTARVLDADVVAVTRGDVTQALERPRVFTTFAAFAAWRRGQSAI